ncbi:MAG: response regulator transcription factor [Acidobacteria bacterium]|nr:response regulator transcription factor [Acidobacteriota bacterium]MBV9475389.1 response regulator transcription factor [Acidobacteriota bacterium]
MTKTRVFLLDDHAVLRQGLRLLIDAQADMQVIGEAARGRGAADAVTRAGGADVVVLDLSLPDASGPAVAAELRAALPETKVVVLTRHAEKAYVQQVLQNGASGYVLKQTAGDELVSAIRTVLSGGTYLDPTVAGKMFESGTAIRGAASDELTAREREVLTMVAYGHTNKEIAAVLGITVKTVETHKANGMQKLDIGSRADLVRYALSQGWLERPA